MYKKKGLILHVDAVQAVGKMKINLAHNRIDCLSISAHKFHGPKGIGALFVRKGTEFSPLFLGGRQERDRRALIGHAVGRRGHLQGIRREVPRLQYESVL